MNPLSQRPSFDAQEVGTAPLLPLPLTGPLALSVPLPLLPLPPSAATTESSPDGIRELQEREALNVLVRKKQMFEKFIIQCGWNRPECFSYTLRQWIFVQLSDLPCSFLKEVDTFSGAFSIHPASWKFSKRPSLFSEEEQTLGRDLLILCNHLSIVKGNGVRLPEEIYVALRDMQEKLAHIGSCQWLLLLRMYLGEETLLHTKIASFCNQPSQPYTDRITFRSVVSSYVKILHCIQLFSKKFFDAAEGLSGTIMRAVGFALGGNPSVSFKRGSTVVGEIASDVAGIPRAVSRFAYHLKFYLLRWNKTFVSFKNLYQAAFRETDEEAEPSIPTDLCPRLLEVASLLSKTLAEVGGKMSQTLAAWPESCSIEDLERASTFRQMKGDYELMRSQFALLGNYVDTIFHAAQEDFQGFSFPISPSSQRDVWSLVDDEDFKERMSEEKQREKKVSKSHGREKERLTMHSPSSQTPLEEASQSTCSLPELHPSLSSFSLQVLNEALVGSSFRSPSELLGFLPTFTALHQPVLFRHVERLLVVVPENLVQKQYCHRQMRGVLHHFYLSSCGFAILSTLIQSQKIELLSAVLPMWMADRALQMELHGDTLLTLRHKTLQTSHSLIDLCKRVGEWEDLSPSLQSYVENLTQGVSWYRYPCSYRRLITESPIPQEFCWLNRCLQITKKDQGITQSVIHEYIDFMVQSHFSSYELLYHMLFAHGGEDLRSLLAPLHHHLEEVGQFLHQCISQPPSQGRVPFSRFSGESDILSTLIERCETVLNGQSRICQQEEGRLALEEVSCHLIRIKNTLDIVDICPSPHFFAFYIRNLFNLQWLVEQMYALELLLYGAAPIRSHRFHDYETFLHELSEEKRTPHDPALFEYNFGIWLHYEELCQRPLSSLQEYRQILQNNIVEATCESGFTPVTKNPIDSLEVFQKHIRLVCRLLESALLPLVEKLQAYRIAVERQYL